jgi:hypothetical protein
MTKFNRPEQRAKTAKTPAKWLPRTRHIADRVPAAALMQILDHERRIMPLALRAHLAELEREALAWHRRQDAAAESRLPAPTKPSDASDDTPPARATRRKSASAKSRGKPMPWKNPRIKRRLRPRKRRELIEANADLGAGIRNRLSSAVGSGLPILRDPPPAAGQVFPVWVDGQCATIATEERRHARADRPR